ncbi:hypothetical protein DUI87_04949 [Hirundo rustica rustica]|uniref:Uncharacterized protein n=1 Tax=Hirundo rustica rustica TaxID=333673 RepID=A0A3M0L510_HIRRU|nr:hypothetical protein DUI87_04949 [Hirundo rustica rustica]
MLPVSLWLKEEDKRTHLQEIKGFYMIFPYTQVVTEMTGSVEPGYGLSEAEAVDSLSHSGTGRLRFLSAAANTSIDLGMRDGSRRRC